MPQILNSTLSVGTYQPPAPVTYKGWWDADAGRSSTAMGAFMGGTKTILASPQATIKGIYGAQASAGYFIYLELDVNNTTWTYIRVSNGVQSANLRRVDATVRASVYGSNTEYSWQVTSATWAFVASNGSPILMMMVDGVLPLTGPISFADIYYEYALATTPTNLPPVPTVSISDYYRSSVAGDPVKDQFFESFSTREPPTGETYTNSYTEFEITYNRYNYNIKWNGATVASGSGDPSAVTIGTTTYFRGTLRNSSSPYFWDYALYRTSYGDLIYYDVNQNVPTSGTISFSDFRGGSKVIPQ